MWPDKCVILTKDTFYGSNTEVAAGNSASFEKRHDFYRFLDQIYDININDLKSTFALTSQAMQVLDLTRLNKICKT